MLYIICLQHVADTPLLEDDKTDDTLAIIEILSDKVRHVLEVLNVSDKYLETTEETLLDKVRFAHVFN